MPHYNFVLFDSFDINNSLIFAIPSKYKEITVLLPHNKNIFFYNNFFSLIFNLRYKFKNHSFIFTSPVIELKIVHLFSGLCSGGGFIKNYMQIHKPDNLVITLNQFEYENFYNRRKLLLENIMNISIKSNNYLQNNRNIKYLITDDHNPLNIIVRS